MAGFLGGYLVGSLLGLLASLAVLEVAAARVRREKVSIPRRFDLNHVGGRRRIGGFGFNPATV